MVVVLNKIQNCFFFGFGASLVVHTPYTNIPSRTFSQEATHSQQRRLESMSSLPSVFQSTEHLAGHSHGGSMAPYVASSDPTYAAIPDPASRAQMASGTYISGRLTISDI